MKVQNIIMLIVALLCGVLAVYLANNYINSEITDYKTTIDAQYKPVQAVVASRNINRGEVLSFAMLSAREVPEAYLHREAIRPAGVDSVIGHKLVFPIKAGESLLASHVAITKGDTFSNLIEDGKRAISFSVDVIASLTGMLAPGDSIDLLMTIKDEKVDKEKTVPLLTNVVVMATGTRTQDIEVESESGGSNRFQTITLHVSPQDAVLITHAQTEGEVTVLLRSRTDSKEVKLSAVDKDILLGRKKKNSKGSARQRGPKIIRAGVREDAS